MTELTVEEQITAKFAGIDPEPAPEPEVEAAETVDDPTPDRPRNADGTFAAAEPEPEVEAETPTLLAGKYKDVGELERAYIEAQSALGRQGNELSDLRGLRDEFTALRDQISQPAAPDPTQIDTYLEDNPHEIPAMAQKALATSDNALYTKTLAAWGQIDPVGAMDFHARAVSDAKLAELRAEIAPALEASRQAATNSEFGDAFKNVSARVPEDFGQVLDGITPETATAMKTVVDMLKTGDLASKEAALETLYWSEKGRQAGNLTQAATQAAQNAAQQGREARQEAVVATTTGSADRQPLSGVDLFHEQFQNSDAFKKAAGLT